MSFELVDECLADGLIADCFVGVVADHEAVAHHAVVDADLLDAQVAGDLVVAALPGQRGCSLLVVAPQLLADHVVPAGALQVAAALSGLKPAVGDPHHPAERPGVKVVLDLADQLLVVGVARPAPHADRDSRAGDGDPDHDLGQVGSVVLAVAVHPERRLDDLAVLVEHIGLGLVALEVGAGRVEEQQIDLEVQQVRGREVDAFDELRLDLQQPVHRPVAGVLVEVVQAGDPGAL
jgi:hypothetical protein